MLKISLQLEKVVAAYKTVAKIPFLLGGKLSNGGKHITSKWFIRNLDKGKATKYTYNYSLDEKLNVVSESEFGSDIGNELLSSVSPREKFRAIIREETDEKGKKQYLEVWSRSTLAHTVDLTALEIHGDVYADHNGGFTVPLTASACAEFAILDWSSDESMIVYIAEKKLKKSEPFIKRKAADKAKEVGSGEAAPKKGEEYVYKEDWCEQLVGKHLSVILVCKVDTETFTVLDGLPDSWCPGQVRFLPGNDSVVGVAWETQPHRLGLIFCSNRPSCVFQLTLDGHMKKLSIDGVAVRSPRVSPGGDILWLQRPADGPHHACHALIWQASDKKQTKTLIDIVQTESKTANGQPFYGIYCQALPARCFASGNRLVFSTAQKLAVKTFVVQIETGTLVDISNEQFEGSTTVLDVHEDIILASCSNMITPAQLFVARLPAVGAESEIAWVRVSEPREVPAAVASATWRQLELTHDNDDRVRSFTALYLAPGGPAKLPLIVWPHGGPHVSFVNAYCLEAAFFALVGFATLWVNYRGSAGAGQAPLEFILKRVGDADVKDCKYATDVVLKEYPIDEKQLCLYGGSHGGFLVAHLSGQYPDFYKAVVARNPVIDIASMINSTDIPDWCAVESGFPYTVCNESEEQLLAMRRCSPWVHVNRVKAATCLMLGFRDLRVPRFQGLQYARALKANGVPVRVQMYDDNHSLSSAGTDNVINAAMWFLQHLQKS